MEPVDYNAIERAVIDRSMNFSGDSEITNEKKAYYEIAVKAAVQVLKEYEKRRFIR